MHAMGEGWTKDEERHLHHIRRFRLKLWVGQTVVLTIRKIPTSVAFASNAQFMNERRDARVVQHNLYKLE